MKKCEYCGKETTETIAKLGHNMTEVTRKEATENTEGQIINKCSVCGKEETITLEKLTQKVITNSTEKQTELIAKKTSAENATKATMTKSITKTPTEPVTEFKWKSAIGNLYNGVELYIVT